MGRTLQLDSDTPSKATHFGRYPASPPFATTTEACPSPTCSPPWTGPCTTGGSHPNRLSRSTPSGTKPADPAEGSFPKNRRKTSSGSGPPATTPTQSLRKDSGPEKDGQDAPTRQRHAV